MSVVKPLGVRWLIGLYEYFKSKPDISIKEAGILIDNKLAEFGISCPLDWSEYSMEVFTKQ